MYIFQGHCDIHHTLYCSVNTCFPFTFSDLCLSVALIILQYDYLVSGVKCGLVNLFSRNIFVYNSTSVKL